MERFAAGQDTERGMGRGQHRGRLTLSSRDGALWVVYAPVHSEFPGREHYHCVFPSGPHVTFAYKITQTFPGQPSI